MDDNKRKIGVFDSGLGGISVLKELVQLMPYEDYVYFGDSEYAPYGIKNKDEIIERCIYICEYFKNQNVKAIVVACNTATSAAIDVLREKYADIHIIGMEPALKVAAYKKESNNIIVMATNLTLNEKKFKNLMKRYSDKNNIIKLPCPELVEIVEKGLIDDKEFVKKQLKKYFSNYDVSKIDSIVLGCTHFVFYKEYIEELLPKTINIVDGNNGTARNLNKILSDHNELYITEKQKSISKDKVNILDNNTNYKSKINIINNNSCEFGNVSFINSSINENEKFIRFSKTLFDR